MNVDVADALSRLAIRLRGPHARLAEVRRLSGGASMDTWAFAVDGLQGREEFILRRRAVSSEPHNSRSVSLQTEAALIQAVAKQAVPVPAFVHLCEEIDGLGEAHVTGRVAGETLGRKIVSDPRFDAVRPRLARQCGEILARIHATPTPEHAVLMVEDSHVVLDRYEEIYRKSGAERAVFELAFRHLRARAPEPRGPVQLHGDFRNGNLIVDSQTGVRAVLDWEMAHRGDPAEDLGWLCVNSWRFGRPDRPVGGFGAYEDLLAGYLAAGGAAMPLGRILYWQALGSLKWGVLCLAMYSTWASGATRSVERPMIGRRVSETEIDLLDLLEAGP